MLTVIIPYAGNQVALSQLLVSLQPQLHPDDDIYILDSSKNMSAVKTVKLYGSTRSYIFVEPVKKPATDSIKYGVQSMNENKQKGAVILPSTSVIPTTLIATIKRGMKQKDFKAFVVLASKVDEMNSNFNWFPPTSSVLPLKDNILTDDDLEPGAMYFSAEYVNKMLEGKELDLTTLGYISECMLILPDYYY